MSYKSLLSPVAIPCLDQQYLQELLLGKNILELFT